MSQIEPGEELAASLVSPEDLPASPSGQEDVPTSPLGQDVPTSPSGQEDVPASPLGQDVPASPLGQEYTPASPSVKDDVPASPSVKDGVPASPSGQIEGESEDSQRQKSPTPEPKPIKTNQDKSDSQSQPNTFDRPLLHRQSGRRGSSFTQSQDFRGRSGILGKYTNSRVSYPPTYTKHPYPNSYFQSDQRLFQSNCRIHPYWHCSCRVDTSSRVFRNPIYATMSAKANDSQFSPGHSFQNQIYDGTRDSLQGDPRSQFPTAEKVRSEIFQEHFPTHRRFVAVATDDRQTSFILPPSHPILAKHPLTPLLIAPTLRPSELETLLKRNQAVSAAALERAMCDVSNGDFIGSIDTIETAISLIKKSRAAHDERCQVLINSLEDTVRVIKQKSIIPAMRPGEGESVGSESGEIVHPDPPPKASTSDRERSRRRSRNRSRSRSRSCRRPRIAPSPPSKRYRISTDRDYMENERSRSRSRDYMHREGASRQRHDQDRERERRIDTWQRERSRFERDSDRERNHREERRSSRRRD